MIKRLLIIWLMMISLWGLCQSKKANEYHNWQTVIRNSSIIEHCWIRFIKFHQKNVDGVE